MAKQKVLAFVWDFTVHPLDLYGWADGLKAALQQLAFEHDWFVKVIASDKTEEIYQQVEELKPDYVLCWGSLDRPSFAGIREVAPGAVIGLCFAGGPTMHPHTDNFDVIFVENEVYEKSFKDQGYNVKRAFGTNEELFAPMKLPKKWIGFYPAAFARWKRHDLFAESLGQDGVAVGKFLEHEMDCVEVCVKNNVAVFPQMPYVAVPYFYAQSRFAVITASSIGGGQRSVLEAMAMNVPPIVMSDSEKCAEYVLDSGYGKVVEPNKEAIQQAIAELIADKIMGKSNQGREYILGKYSTKGYADALHLGLTEIK
jgi:glycosyltransferase involved in cell wall biosynthesis